ncbi:LysR family transcriptional regulator [Streptomyces sp. NPDC056656]|uniref:LysR family transcriptional regulator n=1 Tax=Streptomyces sp. NPDC056656 TaxID=3345895 RepID=UPI0036A8ADB4
MDFRQLEYFVAAAEAPGATRAAKRLRVAPSAVSDAVRRIEMEFRIEAFSHSDDEGVLTPAGQRLLQHARNTLTALARARTDIVEMRRLLTGALTVVTASSTGTLDLAGALTEFHHHHPDLAIRLAPADSTAAEPLARIAEGTADAAVIPLPDERRHDLAVDHVGWIQLALACSRQDSLAESQITYAGLAGRTFVDFPARWANRMYTDALFVAQDAIRDVGVEVSDYASVTALVASGMGIGFLPTELIDNHAELTQVALTPAPDPVPLCLVTRPHVDLSDAALALRRHLISYAQQASD